MERPLFFNLWSSIHFLPRFHAIKAAIGQGKYSRILDLGCGTGLLKKNFPDCDYVGIDNNAEYIDYANKNLTGNFILGDILEPAKYLTDRRFDYIIINGVFHHLNDLSATTLTKNIGAHLNPSGSIIVIDHIYNEKLNYVNKLLLKYDRGSYSRTEASFRKLFEDFAIVSYNEFSIQAGPLVLWTQCRLVLQNT